MDSNTAENFGANGVWNRIRELIRKGLALWWTAGVILLAALVIVILWKVPQWQVEHVAGLTSKEWFDRVNEARKTLATMLGGIVVLAGAYFTWRNIKLTQESVATAQKALMVSQEGQITDRFTKAIEQLGAVDANGKKRLEVRLGGIYALERIANQSERDHWPIVEVLNTYVRENARRPQQIDRKNENTGDSYDPSPNFPNALHLSLANADIQAILTVLGRRDRKWETKNQHLDLRSTDIKWTDLIEADLSEADLDGADLTGADLTGADLTGADLTGARLTEADLSGTDLSQTVLTDAHIDGAHLVGATLNSAHLLGTHLLGADLTAAKLITVDLEGANLTGADFSEADLSKTLHLTQKQIDTAFGNKITKLPENIHMPNSWKK